MFRWIKRLVGLVIMLDGAEWEWNSKGGYWVLTKVPSTDFESPWWIPLIHQLLWSAK